MILCWTNANRLITRCKPVTTTLSMSSKRTKGTLLKNLKMVPQKLEQMERRLVQMIFPLYTLLNTRNASLTCVYSFKTWPCRG